MGPAVPGSRRLDGSRGSPALRQAPARCRGLNRPPGRTSFYCIRDGRESVKSKANKKLLGGLSFVSRTFEGHFKETPYVLDMDANLYIGPADHVSRDEHAAIEVVYQFLKQTGKIEHSLRRLLVNRLNLLEAFTAFDQARMESRADEFQIFIFGTYDGEPLSVEEDDLPAGPCGKSINDLKRRFYALCRRLDSDFDERELDEPHRKAEARFSVR